MGSSQIQGLLEIALGSLQFEQVKASIEIAWVELQHLAKALRRQTGFALERVGVPQSCASADQFWIKRESLNQKLRALLGLALLQANSSEHSQSQGAGRRDLQGFAGFGFGSLRCPRYPIG